MQIKYRSQWIWKVVGFGWILVTILNFRMLYLTVKVMGYMSVVSLSLMATVLAGLIISIFYILITSVDYLRFKENVLSIHRGIVLPRRKIDISMVEEGRIVGAKMVLLLKDEKEVEINTNLITIRDFDRLRSELRGAGICSHRT